MAGSQDIVARSWAARIPNDELHQNFQNFLIQGKFAYLGSGYFLEFQIFQACGGLRRVSLCGLRGAGLRRENITKRLSFVADESIPGLEKKEKRGGAYNFGIWGRDRHRPVGLKGGGAKGGKRKKTHINGKKKRWGKRGLR